jgi:hypothetical protein
MNFNRKISISIKDLKGFIYDAKMLTFADTNNKTFLSNNTSVYSYRQFKSEKEFSGFIYTDEYNGNIVEGGQETVSYDLCPIWRNQYYGGALSFFESASDLEKFVSEKHFMSNIITAFLKQALRSAPKDFPIRGPKIYKANIATYDEFSATGEWEYQNDWDVLPLFIHKHNVDAFESYKGFEKIFFNGKQVYWHAYHGGLIFDKYFPIDFKDISTTKEMNINENK